MKTFMVHVLSPAAASIWNVNALVIDDSGEHDLSPKPDADWELIVSGTATLAEATNALMIPQRRRDRQWNVLREEACGCGRQGLSRRRSPRPEIHFRSQRPARWDLRRLSPPLRT
jgi:hypothetical protein